MLIKKFNKKTSKTLALAFTVISVVILSTYTFFSIYLATKIQKFISNSNIKDNNMLISNLYLGIFLKTAIILEGYFIQIIVLKKLVLSIFNNKNILNNPKSKIYSYYKDTTNKQNHISNNNPNYKSSLQKYDLINIINLYITSYIVLIIFILNSNILNSQKIGNIILYPKFEKVLNCKFFQNIKDIDIYNNLKSNNIIPCENVLNEILIGLKGYTICGCSIVVALNIISILLVLN